MACLNRLHVEATRAREWLQPKKTRGDKMGAGWITAENNHAHSPYNLHIHVEVPCR